MAKIVIIQKSPGLGNSIFLLASAFYLSQLFDNQIEVIHPEIVDLGIQEHPQFLELQKSALSNVFEFNEIVKRSNIEDEVIGLQDFCALPHVYLKGLTKVKSTVKIDFASFARKEVLEIPGILCHVRGSDLWRAYRYSDHPKGSRNWNPFNKRVHSGYVPLPIAYFDTVMEISGEPVKFILEKQNPRWYTKLIQKRYGSSMVFSSTSVLADFATFYESKSLSTAVSTFSWSAALLSKKSKLFYPAVGIFDQNNRPDIIFDSESEANIGISFNPQKVYGDIRDLIWISNSRLQTSCI